MRTDIGLTEPATAGETLEAMIDRFGLENVLSTISEICHEKADHADGLTDAWRRAAA